MDSDGDTKLPGEIARFSLSPGRSISPIDLEAIDVEFLHDLDNRSLSLLNDDDADEELDRLCQPLHFVSLSDIDAQITPLRGAALKAKGLQTIFEGVFLETPPRSGGRTVIPRKKCDTSSSGSDEDGETGDDPYRGLTESFQTRMMIDGEDDDEDEKENHQKPPHQHQQLKRNNGHNAKPNKFQPKRLNLIPGEDC